mgnify:CR=1 FL=1
MELRPYQEEAVKAIENEWSKGNKKTLLVLPCGCGKTICFSKVIEDSIKDGSRALVLAHRTELLTQAAEKLKKVSGLDSALEKAENTSYGSDLQVTLGSVQTLSKEKRLHQFPNDYFKTIVVDEGHHSMSDSYQTILKHFDKANILGVTATPDRSDERNLGQFFDSKAYEYTIAQGIRDGYLSPVKAQLIPLQLDIKDVNVSQGDYNAGEIGNALEPYLNQIANEMLTYCKNRRTIVFLPLIKTSQKFCELLNLHGLRAVEVNGTSKDREKILNDFHNGEYDVLCNSMLLTEGFDEPSIDCVVVLRPTKVRALYQQMVGRGMRLSPETGKKDLLLLDFLWMTEKHNLCRPSALISKDSDIAERIDKKMIASGVGIDLIQANEQVEKDIVREREESLARELEAMKKRKKGLVDPIQYAFSIEAEDLARYEPTFPWEMGPVTDKQKDYLEKHGILPDTVENAGKASLIIDKLKSRYLEGLATPKQIRFLESKGFKHVGVWSFDSANKMINRMAANRWFVPHGIDPKTYTP